MQTFKINSAFSILILSIVFLFPDSMNAQINNQRERVYVKIEVKGLACPYCAFGMEKELKKISGVKNVDIVLKEGLVYISTPIKQKPLKVLLKTIITDAGFTVGEIEYSNVPFKIEKDKNQ